MLGDLVMEEVHCEMEAGGLHVGLAEGTRHEQVDVQEPGWCLMVWYGWVWLVTIFYGMIRPLHGTALLRLLHLQLGQQLHKPGGRGLFVCLFVCVFVFLLFKSRCLSNIHLL